MKLVRAHRLLKLRRDDHFADERVRVEQHVVIEQNVIDANDAVAV